MWACKHCKKEFENLSTSEKANHSRWCDSNPKRDSYNKTPTQLNTAAAIEKRIKKISDAHKNGKYIGSYKKALETKKSNGTLFHSEETKEIIRKKALASKHRRIVRSTRKYKKKDGTEVLLDSSWEEALAIRLDELNIQWTRPDSVKWTDDSGTTHNYFPDFYLTDYDVYLDPKNDLVYNISIKKIEKILEVLPNLKILRTLNECKNFSI